MKVALKAITLSFFTVAVGGIAHADSHIPAGGTVEALENGGDQLRIAFMAFQNNPFWVPVAEGAAAAEVYLAERNTEVDFIDLGDSLSAEAVIAGIEAAVAQEYDGIVIPPIFNGTERAINEAAEAGVPTITIVAEGSNPSDRILFIGQDAYDAGRILGEFIAEKVGDEGKVGVITGYFGAVQHTQRMDGALDLLREEHPGIKIVGPFENEDKADLAYSQVQDMYTANPDLDLVYVTAGGPFGAAKAVQDLGLTGSVGVVGFDHTPENTAYVDTGEMYGLIDQAPFTQAFDASVIMHNYLINGERPESSIRRVAGNLLKSSD